MEQLAATKDTRINLKRYNQTTVTQLGICRVTLEHNNKCKICNFFVVLGIIRHARYQITKHFNYKLQHNRYREKIKTQIAAHTVMVPVIWEVSSTVQTQGQKGAI